MAEVPAYKLLWEFDEKEWKAAFEGFKEILDSPIGWTIRMLRE